METGYLLVIGLCDVMCHMFASPQEVSLAGWNVVTYIIILSRQSAWSDPPVQFNALLTGLSRLLATHYGRTVASCSICYTWMAIECMEYAKLAAACGEWRRMTCPLKRDQQSVVLSPM